MRQVVRRVLTWSVLAAGLNLVSGVLVARALGPADRGLLAVIVAIVAVTCILSSLGCNVSIRHLLPRIEPVGMLRSYLGISSIMAIAQALVTAAVVHFSDRILGNVLNLATVLLACGYGAGFYVSNQLLDALNARGKVQTSARVNCSGSALQLALIVVLTSSLLGRPRLDSVLVVFIGAVALQALASYSVLARELGPLVPRLAFNDIRQLVRIGLPAIGLNIGQVLAYRLDRYLLGIMSGPAAAGVYAIAATPAETIRMPGTAYSQVAMHRVALGQTTHGQLRRDILKLTTVMLVPAATLILVAPWVVPLLFGPEYRGSIVPLQILAVAELALIPFQVGGRALAAQGRTRASGVIGLTGAAAAVVGLVVLVPPWGAEGAAVASVVAYATMSSLTVLKLRQPMLMPRRERVA